MIPFPTAEGVVSRLDRLLEFRDPLGAAAKRFLPRLKSAYLVETASAAEKLARTSIPRIASSLPTAPRIRAGW